MAPKERGTQDKRGKEGWDMGLEGQMEYIKKERV